ncbi:hypothetical protein WAX78_04280 [Bacillus sp. FJAT-53711]|uniref:Uncharacterized protein n=1 Tax=Bacillus yunxiaonensis TaxID=3127665 RepID=A0ABU8FRR3_9BACI
MVFFEGNKTLRQHIFREGNPKVIGLAKEKFKRENEGRLFCEFDFYEQYGYLVDNFIEEHLSVPVSAGEEWG